MVCELNELNCLEGTSFPTRLDDDGGRERCNSILPRRLDGFTSVDLQAELAQSRQQVASELAHSDRKYELHSAGHRRQESVWTHGCWESHANSRVLKTRGETGVQCSGVTPAQRGDYRS